MRSSLNAFQLFLGWHTDRKIVVLQSDDWGSIRMPSLATWKKLDSHRSISVDDPYNRFDALESVDDLSALFDVLLQFRDKNGRYPILTANCVVGNPDFLRIRQSHFEGYFWEPVHRTFEAYRRLDAFKLWFEGIKSGVFMPQFHGREHVNVGFWLEKLRENHPGVREAFDVGVFGANFEGLGLRKRNFQAAWDFCTPEQNEEVCRSIVEGMAMFEELFGMKSVTVTPPSYTWSRAHESILFQIGSKGIQTIQLQKEPVLDRDSYARRRCLTRYKSQGISYLQRNVFFEPTLFGGQQVGTALQRLKVAFACRKPAIICSHRLNYIGSLSEKNRRQSLAQLQQLLTEILVQWPDVEFMSSAELLGLMRKEDISYDEDQI